MADETKTKVKAEDRPDKTDCQEVTPEILEKRKTTKSNLGEHLGKPFTREQCAKGGRNASKARKEKKTIAETTRQALEMPVVDERMLKIIEKSGMPMPEHPTYKDLIVAQTIMGMAKRGKPEELRTLMDITGEKDTPQNNVITVSIE